MSASAPREAVYDLLDGGARHEDIAAFLVMGAVELAIKIEGPERAHAILLAMVNQYFRAWRHPDTPQQGIRTH
jgi:hypothetical protein